MLQSQGRLLSTGFHHPLRDKLRIPQTRDTLHIWDTLLPAHHAAQRCSRNHARVEASLWAHQINTNAHSEPFRGGGTFLMGVMYFEPETWPSSRGAGCQCDTLSFGQLCAVSPCALPWSLCHQVGDSRSFSHGSLEAAFASEINFP